MISDVITDRCEKVYGSGSLGKEFWSQYMSLIIGPKSNHRLALSVRHSVMLILSFALFVGFIKIDTWISLKCYMDLSKLLQGFVKVVTWIC